MSSRPLSRVAERSLTAWLLAFPLRFPTESPMCEHIGLSFLCAGSENRQAEEHSVPQPAIFHSEYMISVMINHHRAENIFLHSCGVVRHGIRIYLEYVEESAYAAGH